ncbi:Septum formation protein Maf [Prochlorococcus sp. MIT 0601]|nr:Septum formation protein Maf [Prochlorococcus sp. MIT 0601]
MLILGSASKARRNLLKQVDIKHKVIVSDVNEDQFSGSDVGELVQSLAVAKAKAVLSKISNKTQNSIFDCKEIAILCCDSLFEFDGQIYGKPKTEKVAMDRLSKMSSKSGYIHTGHCLIMRPNVSTSSPKYSGMIVNVITTKINFAKLADLEIEKYVKTNEPICCAGGFAIDGKGATLIESIEGCYSNVIGLSLPWLRDSCFKVGFEL